MNPLPPCSGRPGSRPKIEALAARYASGSPLWDPADASFEDDPQHRDVMVGPDETACPDGEELDDDNRLNIEKPKLDSWSGRASWRQGAWSAQFSGGH